MNNIEILEDWLKEMDEHFKRTHINNTKEREALRFIIQEYKELKEYKKIAELTKISCCTAQNCEALNNAIKNGLENEKLLQENKELKKQIPSPTNPIPIEYQTDIWVLKRDYISKLKIKEKIEDYDKMIKATYGDITYYGDYRRKVCFEIRQILQELLEGE